MTTPLTDVRARTGGRVLTVDDDAAIREMRRLFELQRQAVTRSPYRTLSERRADLDRLASLLRHNRWALVAAMDADFGGRSTAESRYVVEIASVGAVEHARRNLARWMRPRAVRTGTWFLPGSSRVVPQPLGVVGIVSPWNYPVNLTVVPLAAALAAGNRVLLKLSELTPRTTALLTSLLHEAFPRERVAVITGEVDVARAFTSLPFDHLLFTGSTEVGREVARAAADSLTPVTLELSGKSPVLVAPDHDPAEAGVRTAWGKLFNAGQTCVAPDYVLVPADGLDAFIAGFERYVARAWRDPASDPAYTSVATSRQVRHLDALVDDAARNGARVHRLGASHAGTRRMVPTLLIDPSERARCLKEEVFGPVLPVVTYRRVAEALQHIARRPDPLAVYLFTHDASLVRHVQRTVRTGGMTVNDTLLHYLQDDLPFGGVGASGQGRYHGRAGFDTFSNPVAVFQQRGLGNATGTKLLYPPTGRVAEALLRMMRR